MWRIVLALSLGAISIVPISAKERQLELRGKIDPPPEAFATVTLHGSTTPFHDETFSGPGGSFRFKKLEAGTYTVIVFLPGRGSVSRTAVVSNSLADKKGRIAVTIPFAPSAESIEASNSVSVAELSIPNSARKEYNQAQKALGKRDTRKARQHLLKAVETAPNFVAAWNNLGTMAYQEADYPNAEKYFREALKHEPGDYAPVVNLGGTLLSMGRYQEALQYNVYAVQQRPGEALAHSQLGQNHFNLGDLPKALEHLKKAKEIDPSHFSHPQLVLARLYSQIGDHNAVAAELRDFLKRFPDSPRTPAVRRWLEQLKTAPPRP